MNTHSKRTSRKAITTGTILFGAALLVVMTTAMGLQERQERSQEANITRGNVVSADATEVVVRADADEKVFVFRVLNRWRVDGTRGLDADVSAFTAALKEGDSVVVNWGYAQEGEFHFIRTIQTGEYTMAFTRDRNIVVGWVLGSTDQKLTIETVEQGKEIDFTLPFRRGERAEREREREQETELEMAIRSMRVPIGQLVLVSYRKGEGASGLMLNRVRAISF